MMDPYAALSFDAMGCRFEALIDAERSGIGRLDARAICEDIRALVLDWHRRLSVFEPGSVVSRINRSPGGVAVELDADMFALCAQCEHLRARTGGAFNIAAGTLMRAHGLRGVRAEPVGLGGLDLDHAIVLDAGTRTICRTDDRVSLDFGAVGKGFVLDLVRDELGEHGVEHAFIHGGTSSILAIGTDHENRAWSMRIDPINESHPPCTLELGCYAAAISQTTARRPERGNPSVGHVMDPRTNRPAGADPRRMACVHPSAAAADAYATACCVDPGLVERLGGDPCTLVVFEASGLPIVHDPLGVVRTK